MNARRILAAIALAVVASSCAATPPFESDGMGPDAGTTEHASACATHPTANTDCPTEGRVK